METKKFSLQDVEIIQENDQLNDDQLSAIIGGRSEPIQDENTGDCKCGDVNCNVN